MSSFEGPLGALPPTDDKHWAKYPLTAEALPEWLLSGPINEWSERDRKRRNFVMRESDAIARAIDDDGDDGGHTA